MPAVRLRQWLGAIFTAQMNVWMATVLRFRGAAAVCQSPDGGGRCEAEVVDCGDDEAFNASCALEFDSSGGGCAFTAGQSGWLEPGRYVVAVALCAAVYIQLQAINRGLEVRASFPLPSIIGKRRWHIENTYV
jgi:hypothetical protein